MIPFLLVGAGGALGAMSRYGFAILVRAWISHPFPVATLAINLLGSFAIGLLFQGLKNHEHYPELVLLLGVGFLGGFTTFSAFSLEILDFVRKGEVLWALGYALASVILGLGAVALGWFLGR